MKGKKPAKKVVAKKVSPKKTITRTAKVVIAIPTKDGNIHARLVQNIIPQLKDHLFMIIAGVSPVAHARNRIVEAFLKTDATHLWMIDHDVIPPADALEKMIRANKPVVTAVTPMLDNNNLTSNIFADNTGVPLSMQEIEKHAKKKHNLVIKGATASCVLIERSVFQKLSAPYFAEIWTANAQHITADIYFSNTLTKAGIDITCIPSVRAGHVKSVVL